MNSLMQNIIWLYDYFLRVVFVFWNSQMMSVFMVASVAIYCQWYWLLHWFGTMMSFDCSNITTQSLESSHRIITCFLCLCLYASENSTNTCSTYTQIHWIFWALINFTKSHRKMFTYKFFCVLCGVVSWS